MFLKLIHGINNVFCENIIRHSPGLPGFSNLINYICLVCSHLIPHKHVDEVCMLINVNYSNII